MNAAVAMGACLVLESDGVTLEAAADYARSRTTAELDEELELFDPASVTHAAVVAERERRRALRGVGPIASMTIDDVISALRIEDNEDEESTIGLWQLAEVRDTAGYCLHTSAIVARAERELDRGAVVRALLAAIEARVESIVMTADGRALAATMAELIRARLAGRATARELEVRADELNREVRKARSTDTPSPAEAWLAVLAFVDLAHSAASETLQIELTVRWIVRKLNKAIGIDGLRDFAEDVEARLRRAAKARGRRARSTRAVAKVA